MINIYQPRLKTVIGLASAGIFAIYLFFYTPYKTSKEREMFTATSLNNIIIESKQSRYRTYIRRYKTDNNIIFHCDKRASVGDSVVKTRGNSIIYIYKISGDKFQYSDSFDTSHY